MASAFPPALTRLIKDLEGLPGVGEKTATRFAIQVLKWPELQARELAAAITELHQKVRLCSQCFTFSEKDPCPVCSDPHRDRNLLCVVEDPADLLALEKAGAYRGLYHVLHGIISPMDGIGPDQLKISELLERIKAENISEVILATSSTAGGEATSAYLSHIIEKENCIVTRIACGIPMGMDIKYADSMTLKRSMEARLKI
jgi:recombination protein RecR